MKLSQDVIDEAVIECPRAKDAAFMLRMQSYMKQIEAENLQLRECLEWYAEEDFYHYPTGDEMAETGCYAVKPIEVDKGLRARNALKELENVK